MVSTGLPNSPIQTGNTSRYALIRPSEDQSFIQKEISFKVSLEVLQNRLADLQLYNEELQRANTNIPDTDLSISEKDGAHSILIKQRKIHGKSLLAAFVLSESDNLDPLIRSSVSAIAPVIATMYSSRPVGYDTGLDNFIYNAETGKSTLFDIVPPRLGFKLAADGKPVLIERDQLLVDYPENGGKSAKEQAPYRRFYYTPEGTIEHMLAWIVSSRFAFEQQPMKWQEIHAKSEVQTLIATTLLVFSRAGFGIAANQVKGRVSTAEWSGYLDHRLLRISDRFKKIAGSL